MNDTQPRRGRWAGAGHIALLAAWFALAAGLVQPVMFLIRRVGLDKPIMQSVQVVWMAPVAYLVFVLPVAVLALGLRRFLPRWFDERTATFAFALLTTWSLVLTFSGLVHGIALFILALGTTVQIWRAAGPRAAALITLARRSVLLLAAGVVVLALAVNGWVALAERRAVANLPEAEADTPSVVLIILDTVRALSMSLYGFDQPNTPHLARLAEEGVVFDRAIATAPWTLPSHASMFTGQFPYLLDADWGAPMSDRYPTLAETLRGRGHATGGFVANTFYASWETGLDRGFIRYRDFRMSPGQIVKSTGLSRMLFGTFTQSRLLRLIGFYDVPGRKTAEMVNREFLRWADGLNGRPFFAFLNYFDAHDPYIPPEPFASRFSARPADRNIFQRIGSRLGLFGDDSPTRTDEEWAQYLRTLYEATIAYVDDQVGQLVADLESRGMLDRTMIIVTSDHGEAFSDHGVSGHGKRLYTEQVHVPLLIRHPPAVPAGLRVSREVTLRGIPATVHEIVSSGSHPFPGVSLAAYWADSLTVTDTVLTELSRDGGKDDRTGASRSVVVEGIQYIYRMWDDREEAYDLRVDPRQERNLARGDSTIGLEQYRRILQAMPAPPGSPLTPPEIVNR